MVALMVSTSLAVASFASVWWVPPYFALMVAILFAPLGRREAGARDLAEPDAAGVVEASESVSSAATEPARDGSLHLPLSIEPSEDPVTVSEPSPAPTRRGKGRGRGRKTKGKGAEPTGMAWIRVGPGQFVRVDAPVPGRSVEETSTSSVSPWDEPLAGRDEASPPTAPGPVAAADEPVTERAGVIPPPGSGPLAAVEESVSERDEVVPESARAAALPPDEAVLERWPRIEDEPRVGNDVAAGTVGNADAELGEAEDNGIAPDASCLVPGAECAPEAVFSPMSGTLAYSLRGAWPPDCRSSRAGRGAESSPTGRGARTSRSERVNPGRRRHARREFGRSRQARRTFPPRSPPGLAGARERPTRRAAPGQPGRRPSLFWPAVGPMRQARRTLRIRKNISCLPVVTEHEWRSCSRFARNRARIVISRQESSFPPRVV